MRRQSEASSALVRRGFIAGLLALGLILPLGAAEAQNGTVPKLEGAAWVRVSPLEGTAVIDPNQPAQTIVFRAGGISGSTGCNGYGGGAELADGLFKLGPLRMSRRACNGPVQQSEQDYMARLTSAAQWWLRGGDLYLANAQGTPLLRFMRE